MPHPAVGVPPGLLEGGVEGDLRVDVLLLGLESADCGFDVARLRVARIAGKLAARLERLNTAGEDRDAMVRTLTAPNRVVTGCL